MSTAKKRIIVEDVYNPLEAGSIDGSDTFPHDKAITRAIQSKYKLHDKNSKGFVNCTIFISGLNQKTTESTLTKKFEKFGQIKSCTIVRDIITGISKCYAFMEFKNSNSANNAVYEMNMTSIDDHNILVDFELERTLKGWKPRRLGGGFGGKKESGQLRFGCRNRPYQF